MSHALFLLMLALGISDDPLHLAIGDPARKDREVSLSLDTVTDSATGATLTPEELAARLSGVRLLLIGESHTNIDFHRVQLRVLEGLVAAGRRVLVGLEMYPYTEQVFLDQWGAGLLTEKGFVGLSHWYKNWGYNWGYYRDIFLFAKESRVPLFAVNTPREVVSAVRKKGFQNLTPEEAAHLPPRVDTESAEHFSLFKSFFDEDDSLHGGLTEEQWKSMFSAQCTWDATMGYNAVQALKNHGDPDAIMVVLIGSGHVAYGLGIERQAALTFEGKMASVIPVPVVDAKKKAVETVRASYADFLWGVPPEGEPMFPSLGLSFAAEGKLEVIHVEKDSIGEKSGFQVGDRISAIDGASLLDKEGFNRLLAQKRWGDSARFEIVRAGRPVSLAAYLRRRF